MCLGAYIWSLWFSSIPGSSFLFASISSSLLTSLRSFSNRAGSMAIVYIPRPYFPAVNSQYTFTTAFSLLDISQGKNRSLDSCQGVSFQHQFSRWSRTACSLIPIKTTILPYPRTVYDSSSHFACVKFLHSRVDYEHDASRL